MQRLEFEAGSERTGLASVAVFRQLANLKSPIITHSDQIARATR